MFEEHQAVQQAFAQMSLPLTDGQALEHSQEDQPSCPDIAVDHALPFQAVP